MTAEPVWLDDALARGIHAELIAEHGGLGIGVNEALLAATLARPQQRLAYGDAPPSVFELAASYGFGFAKNHCFSDGNKRVALMAIYVFLKLNGFVFGAPEVEAVAAIQDLAAGKLSERKLGAWIEAHSVKLKPRR